MAPSFWLSWDGVIGLRRRPLVPVAGLLYRFVSAFIEFCMLRLKFHLIVEDPMAVLLNLFGSGCNFIKLLWLRLQFYRIL